MTWYSSKNTWLEVKNPSYWPGSASCFSATNFRQVTCLRFRFLTWKAKIKISPASLTEHTRVSLLKTSIQINSILKQKAQINIFFITVPAFCFMRKRNVKNNYIGQIYAKSQIPCYIKGSIFNQSPLPSVFITVFGDYWCL